MKKILIFLLLFCSQMSFTQTPLDVSRQELSRYNFGLGLRFAIDKQPNIENTRRFFGNLTTDTLIAKLQENLATILSQKASTNNSSFTGSIVLPGSTTIGNINATELSYLSGLSSNIQNQFNNKVDKSTGKGLSTNDFTNAYKAKADSLAYNFSQKANLNSPAFTGTVSGITKSMVGLSNVDNISDLNKPISTPTQQALNLKANSSSPIFSGNVGIGTSSPNYLLSVAGITNTSQLIINSSINNGNVLQVTGVSNFSGNVGIGTQTSSSQLDIFNNSTGSALRIGAAVQGTSNDVSIDLYGKNGAFTPVYGRVGLGINNGTVGGEVGFMTFSTINSGVLSERVRISQTGDLEIQTVNTGLIIKAPNGSRWRITVSNTGILTTTAL